MKKLFIITLATITLGSYTPSFARITSIESYRGITVDYAKASEGCASAYSQTCASPLEGEG
ncbi:MAG: hypothetical protein IJ529_06220, partial [Alphaproteobacteria bacterium]|nr:hypothetical protein [Alphaproteobacteria bacterium]